MSKIFRSPPPRPHPLTRSHRVDRLNGWLESAWRKGLSTRPMLDPDELWAKALKNNPADGETASRLPEDAADFRLRLEVLAESLVSEARLNPLGLTMAHGQLTRNIRQRLAMGEMWRKRPATISQNIAAPIIIVGQMRSGTTRLHRLLAADPAHAATRFCDSWQPVPRTPDTRPAWSALSLTLARAIDPWLDAIHPFGVTRPDEELGWLAAALDHCAYEAQWRVPTFTAFSEKRDPAPVYREFARILRTDAHARGNAHQPRVMKVPQFAEDLPALLAQFPNARVVLTRRCKDDLAKSAASLVANQMTLQSNEVDMRWIESEVVRKIALRQTRMDHALAEFAGPIAQVDFISLEADWEGAIASVYDQLGLPFRHQTLTAMHGEQGRASKSRHHSHAATYQAFAEA